MKRVAIDGRLILPHMSGIGRALTGLCRGLAGLEADELSYELWLQRGLPPDHPALQLASPRLRLVELPARHMSLSAQARLPLELLRRRPDLYHYPHFDLPALAPGRSVVTIHDLKYLANPQFFPHQGRLKRLAVMLMARRACRRARRVLCDSEFTAGDLERRLGVGREKLRVVPLGVDEAFFEPLPLAALQAFRRQRGLEQPYLLCVGERRPHKNLPGLILAFERFARQARQPYRLVIAGRPYADYRAPEALVERLGLLDRVTFIDYAQETVLPALYQGAALFCLLSLYEGFGLPLLEAMASGVPVVASDRTALPETAGRAARLVPPDDPEQAAQAFQALTSDAAGRAQAVALGRERARGFTWARCARLTRDVYREALDA